MCATVAFGTPATQPGTDPVAVRSDTLRFTIVEGSIENTFYRQGAVAAHVLASSGASPRLIVAFPAGNTGVAVWFGHGDPAVKFTLSAGTEVQGVERPDGMRGVTAQLSCTAAKLTVSSAVLGNIRMIRDSAATESKQPPSGFAAQISSGSPVVLRRTTVDGAHHVELDLLGSHGTTIEVSDGVISLHAGPSGRIAFSATALADDTPLTPFVADALFKAGVADRRRDKEVFAFLASHEKFDAGSWRFLTYFGRDTLLSLQMLMPVLQPPVIEAGLGSVIERLRADGEVAHEEGIGEFAAIENLKQHPPPADVLQPVYDYKMVDGAFLLAPAAASYLLDTPEGRARAAQFLARRTSTGEPYAQALERNLALVLTRAAPFAVHPVAETLVALKPGVSVGEWRDSNEGLGGGRYPFDVNVALVPAALKATARLYRSGLLGDGAQATARAEEAERAASVWNQAGKYFRQTLPAAEAKARITAYAKSVGLGATPAIKAIGGDVAFDAISLDADGKPVPIVNSDGGFVLFFTTPSAGELDTIAETLVRPFPAGLMTHVGMVVANPAFVDQRKWDEFSRDHYHGTVVWSWQQALMAAGLRRQLGRSDLPATTRAKLVEAENTLWRSIAAMRQQSAGELWTWQPHDGIEVLTPFGQATGHVDESNAAQLWSTVYLAVQPPR